MISTVSVFHAMSEISFIFSKGEHAHARHTDKIKRALKEGDVDDSKDTEKTLRELLKQCSDMMEKEKPFRAQRKKLVRAALDMKGLMHMIEANKQEFKLLTANLEIYKDRMKKLVKHETKPKYNTRD